MDRKERREFTRELEGAVHLWLGGLLACDQCADGDDDAYGCEEQREEGDLILGQRRLPGVLKLICLQTEIPFLSTVVVLHPLSHEPSACLFGRRRVGCLFPFVVHADVPADVRAVGR